MKLSVALAILNEETVITRCLDSIYDLADEVVIVDGGSTDKTLAIIKKFDKQDKVHVLHEENPPMFHINKQKAIEKCTGEWILQLDADEVVSDDLKEEISVILSEAKDPGVDGYWIPRLNYFLGRPLRKGGQYPDPTIRLYKNGKATFPCKTVHEQVEIDGEVITLKNALLHYPYMSFASYINKWVRYSTLEAEESYKKGVRPSLYNAIMYFKVYPTVWFLKTYFRHKGCMDGFPGFVFSLFSSLRYWVEYVALYEKVRGEEVEPERDAEPRGEGKERMIGRKGEEERKMGSFRGAGRFQEALNDAGRSVAEVPIWDPYASIPLKPGDGGVVMIFDIVPLKFKQHFPIGLKGKINLFKNKRAIRNFSVILTISEHARNDIISYFSVPPQKVHVVHLPVGKPFLTTSPAPAAGREQLPTSYILYVGDVNWNKNLPLLASAIKLGKTPCIFVGKEFDKTYWTDMSDKSDTHPWRRPFKEFLDLAKDDPKFILKGYVSDEELVTLYKNAVCNVLVSHDEGFGYSYIEAASQGTPSVLSYIPIFKETAGETALFADPNSPQDIADKIKSLVEDKLKRDELGKEAKTRVLEMYSLERFRAEITDNLGG